MADFQVVSRMDELRERAARLNAATGTANSIISDIEKQLVESNLGIEAWLARPLRATDETGSTRGESEQRIERLGFAKIDGRWCLATKQIRVVSGFFEGDTSCPYTNEYLDEQPAPLLKASRDVRIKALELLPELVELLTERTDERIRAIEEARDMLT